MPCCRMDDSHQPAAGAPGALDPFTDILANMMAQGSQRSAAVLAEMTKHPVSLLVPAINLSTAREVPQRLRQRFGSGLTRVTVPFSGTFTGSGSLLLDKTSAESLARAFPEMSEGNLSQDEVLVEVGSVLLNACIGTFGNLLPTNIRFGVPEIRSADTESAITTLLRLDHSHDTLWAETEFNLHHAKISGIVVVCASVAVMRSLLVTVEARPRAKP